MAKIIQLSLTAKRPFYPSVRSQPTLHGAPACLSYGICTMIARLHSSLALRPYALYMYLLDRLPPARCAA
eukprot:scaffold43092_cov66-Phaeocystis_antarctica.AAC.2